MPIADIDEVLHGNIPVLFAQDQRPFEHARAPGVVHTFGVLVPLLTEAGKRFEDLEDTFENRGRVWWMLMPEHVKEVNESGAIVTGVIERAPQFDSTDPDKDRYQVVRRTVSYGAREWVDLLDVPFDPRDGDRTLGPDGIPVDRPPLRLVLLRGAGHVVGPFHSSWKAATRRITLTATNVGKPQAFVVPASALKAGEHFEEFRFRANRWYPGDPQRDVVVRLAPRKILDVLERTGTTIDAASDDQVIKWALGLAHYIGAERSAFREAMSRLPASVPAENDIPGRLDRFKALCQRAERIRSLGLEAAEALAKQPAFADLVRTRLDELVQGRVADLVKAKTLEVEKAVADASARQTRLQLQVAQLAADYDRRKTEQEARLAAEQAEWIRRLEHREQDLAERESALGRRQEEMETRIRAVVERYETRGREIGNDVLALAPILGRMGFGQGGSAREAGEESPVRLTLPSWTQTPRPRGGLTEPAFLDQFRDVAARRGFVLAPDDLANFHVAAKVGVWTVLAGPSGTGKTSLPRLYAEALGASDEYLTVPVRPDWLDDRDVLGAFNALAGRFEPAATGLVDRLIAAADDLSRARGGLYVVCLDEMNLARVEHYFAQFLSVAEEPVARRRLQLFSRGVERPGEPYAPWRELPLGENVRVVGTVNVDETTHFFSPKVLDRAPVVVLEPPEIHRAPAPKAKAQSLEVVPVHFEEYAGWIRGPEHADESVRALLLQVDGALRPIRSGLGFRIRDRILAHTASARGLLSEDRALDLALAQSVLPRLRTANPGFQEAIAALAGLLPEARFPRSGRMVAALREAGGSDDFFQLL
jgi:energy-coupling factor transporter ATP-binding protein EcfA2